MNRLTRRAMLASGAGAALAGTLIAAGFHGKRADAGPALPARDAALPDFSFTDAAGRRLSLADYRGRGVMVNFWATWCHPCVEEMPSLDTLAARLAPQGIAVLPLSSDQGGAAVVQRFYQAHGLKHLPVMLDPEMEAGHALDIIGTPTTILVDAAGRERARILGSQDWDGSVVETRIRSLIGAAAGPVTGAI